MNEFYVRISKKGDTKGIFVCASTLDSTFDIDSIAFADDVNAHFENYRSQKAVEFYPGPSFSTLDERLQSEFTDFLNSVGVDETLCSFINVLSNDKDQRLYHKWLKNVNGFFS
jgi:hypothetical protein